MIILPREFYLENTVSVAKNLLGKKIVPDVQIVDKSFELGKFDLVFEVSGNPKALDQAIALCGYEGRVIVGSWYGDEDKSELNLGSHFHRNKIGIYSLLH